MTAPTLVLFHCTTNSCRSMFLGTTHPKAGFKRSCVNGVVQPPCHGTFLRLPSLRVSIHTCHRLACIVYPPDQIVDNLSVMVTISMIRDTFSCRLYSAAASKARHVPRVCVTSAKLYAISRHHRSLRCACRFIFMSATTGIVLSACILWHGYTPKRMHFGLFIRLTFSNTVFALAYTYVG